MGLGGPLQFRGLSKTKQTVVIQNWSIISQDPLANATGKYAYFHRIGGFGTIEAQGEITGPMNKFLQNRFFAWWYFAIAAGFCLLAINRWMLGERFLLVGLRLGIAAGFLVLGWLTWRGRG